jgi:CRP/FNR family transcriptional regulator, cyclic AMP receptor protein
MSAVSAAELGQHPFAGGLTFGQCERLAAVAAGVGLPPGRRLFEEGGPATRFWLIRTGRVALDLRVPGRDRLIVETVGPGDEVGLSWLMPAPQWQFGAITQLPVSAFEIDSAAVVELCAADHELGYQLTRRLLTTAISRLTAARIRILDLYAGPSAVTVGGRP